jgi:hypothetical protein
MHTLLQLVMSSPALVIVSASVFIITAVTIAFKAWASVLRWKRRGSDEQTFIRMLHGYDPAVLHAVYQVLSKYGPVQAFPIMPNDTLKSTLGLADDDLEDVLVEIARAARKNAVGVSSGRPIKTVEDVASWVQDLPALVVNDAE